MHKNFADGSINSLCQKGMNMKSNRNGHVDITLRINQTHRIVACYCSVRVIDVRPEFNRFRDELGTVLIAMVRVLVVDEDDDGNDDDGDRDCRFRSRLST